MFFFDEEIFRVVEEVIVVMKASKNIFIIVFIVCIRVVGMELQINSGDKQELDLNTFIDKMYQCEKKSKDLVELSKQCSDEHKSSLINYFVKKATVGVDVIKDHVVNDDLYGVDQKNFNMILKYIITHNRKEHVKYYIPFSNASRCIALLRKEIGLEEYQDEWSQYKNFADLMKNDVTVQRTVNDICSFFYQESSLSNFIYIHNTVCSSDYIVTVNSVQKAAQKQNIPVLILLFSDDLLLEEQDKIDSYLYDSVDKEREFLAKADYYMNIEKLTKRAIEENALNKAWSFLRIYIARGHRNVNIVAQLMLKLLQAGFKITTDTLKTYVCDELRMYVEQGYKIEGESFWDDEAHQRILHKAVQEKNKEFVKYLLLLKSPTNLADENGKTPLLYSLNNDEIFNMLIEISPCTSEMGNDHDRFYSGLASKEPIKKLEIFIENSPEKKIIQLFEKNFFSKEKVWLWFDCAIKLKKVDLFRSLFEKYKEKISASQRCELLLAACELEIEQCMKVDDQKKEDSIVINTLKELKSVPKLGINQNTNQLQDSMILVTTVEMIEESIVDKNDNKQQFEEVKVPSGGLLWYVKKFFSSLFSFMFAPVRWFFSATGLI